MNALYCKIYPAHNEADAEIVVMLHGWGLNHAVWESTALALQSSATVHCLDLPGHGNSALGDACKRPIFGILQHAVDAISTYILSLAKPVVLLGWSLGGLIAKHVSLQHPHLIAKLVLVSTTPYFVQNQMLPNVWPHAMAQKSLRDFAQRLQTNQAATIRSFLCLQMLNLPNAKSVAAKLATQLAQNGEASAQALNAWLAVLEQTDIRDKVSRLAAHPLLPRAPSDRCG